MIFVLCGSHDKYVYIRDKNVYIRVYIHIELLREKIHTRMQFQRDHLIFLSGEEAK